MYLFAKRLLGSTLFAAVRAAMLVLDGMHFTQSRIATPEITVAFFSLSTLYAFYRFWLASRVRVAPLMPPLATLVRQEGLWLVVATAAARRHGGAGDARANDRGARRGRSSISKRASTLPCG